MLHKLQFTYYNNKYYTNITVTNGFFFITYHILKYIYTLAFNIKQGNLHKTLSTAEYIKISNIFRYAFTESLNIVKFN